MDESTRMLPGLAIGIVLMIILVSKTKVHTFIPLLLAAITKKWTGRRQDWSRIHAQLSIYFAERMPD